MRTLIKNALVLTMEKSRGAGGEVLDAPFLGEVAIENGKILSVSAINDTEHKYDDTASYNRVVDAKGQLMMPGLINAHGHAAMALFRGYADDMALFPWLSEKIWPIEDRLDANDVYNGTMLAIAEMLLSGTTTFTDMYFFMDDTARAVAESGIRACLSQGLTEPSTGEGKLQMAVDFARRWQGGAENRITTMLGPHAPYTNSSAYLQKIIAAAHRYNLPMQIHLAETETEIKQITERDGCRPVKLLADIGFFDGMVLAAHGVYINEDEMAFLAEREVSFAHNPRSNMKLASGISPVEKMQSCGINVALGTDSACSNNNLDMFQEMRAAVLLAKLKDLDPIALPAPKALEMATVCGARALGLNNVGRIKAGFEADLILVNLNKAHLSPAGDIISHLVYSASGGDVTMTMVAGNILVEDGRLLGMDIERIIKDANASMRRLTV